MAQHSGRIKSHFRVVGALTVLVLLTVCGGNQSSQSNDQAGQKWQLDFADSMHPQSITVGINPFTNSGTFGEFGSSPGLWMFGPDGVCKYRLPVAGNIVHDSSGDRWSSVNLGGAGCGMQTLGTLSLTSDGNFPNATRVSGTCTLTTDSPLGQVRATTTVTGHKL